MYANKTPRRQNPGYAAGRRTAIDSTDELIQDINGVRALWACLECMMKNMQHEGAVKLSARSSALNN